jgi:pyruvate/2-oxoglutarate dehydrogenase complex dihydrolipoamide dehydrogenase (E3) component
MTASVQLPKSRRDHPSAVATRLLRAGKTSCSNQGLRLNRVGTTDAEAAKSGRRLLHSKRPMTRVGRAVEKGERQGFMKVVADAHPRKILGAAILGTAGDEAIQGILDMMNADQTIDTLRWAVPIHPTVSELIPTVLLEPSAKGP